MVASNARPRLLIFVIAYYAESTLRSVLERIPSRIFEEYDAHILVVDDGSEDRTFVIGREYLSNHPDIRMSVLRNEYNHGYGGNPKIGYSYAIKERFDFVAMVHGDGQCAPRLFTFRSIRHLLRDTGFVIKKVRGVPAPFPKVLGNGRLGRAAIATNLALIRVSKSLFAYQIYIEAEGTPGIEFLLRDAAEKSEWRARTLLSGGRSEGAATGRAAGDEHPRSAEDADHTALTRPSPGATVGRITRKGQ